MVLAGAGIGLMFSPANTDAINRAPRTSYGEATGIAGRADAEPLEAAGSESV